METSVICLFVAAAVVSSATERTPSGKRTGKNISLKVKRNRTKPKSKVSFLRALFCFCFLKKIMVNCLTVTLHASKTCAVGKCEMEKLEAFEM